MTWPAGWEVFVVKMLFRTLCVLCLVLALGCQARIVFEWEIGAAESSVGVAGDEKGGV